MVGSPSRPSTAPRHTVRRARFQTHALRRAVKNLPVRYNRNGFMVLAVLQNQFFESLLESATRIGPTGFASERLMRKTVRAACARSSNEEVHRVGAVHGRVITRRRANKKHA